MKLHEIYIPGKSDMLIKDFYKRNNIDSSEYTICLWLENCVGNPVGIPHVYDNLSLTEAYEKVLVEGDKVLQKKGCLPSEFIHHMKIAQRKYCVNLSEEIITPSIQHSTRIEQNASTNLPAKRATTLGFFNQITPPFKSDMLVKDFYKRNNIDSSEYTMCLWLENCVGNPVGIPHKYDDLSLTEACERVLIEGDQVLQKKGCLPSEFIHHMKIAQRKYCVNLSEESITPSIQHSTRIERNASTNLPEKRATTLGFFNKIDPPFKSDMLVKDFYKINNIDPSEYTMCFWLENCVGNPVGIPHKYDELSLTEASERVLVEGDKVLQKKGYLPSEFVHQMKIAQRKYCINLSEECDTSIGLVPK